MSRNPLKTMVFVVFCLYFQACASGESISPMERVVGLGQNKIEEGRTKGQTSADEVPDVYLKLRYNPAGCDVPAFEVHSHERWTRVYLDGNQEVQEGLQDLERHSQIISWVSYLEISGKFSGRRRTESGVQFPVFIISDLRKTSIAHGSSRAAT